MLLSVTFCIKFEHDIVIILGLNSSNPSTNVSTLKHLQHISKVSQWLIYNWAWSWIFGLPHQHIILVLFYFTEMSIAGVRKLNRDPSNPPSKLILHFLRAFPIIASFPLITHYCVLLGNRTFAFKYDNHSLFFGMAKKSWHPTGFSLSNFN